MRALVALLAVVVVLLLIAIPIWLIVRSINLRRWNKAVKEARWHPYTYVAADGETSVEVRKLAKWGKFGRVVGKRDVKKFRSSGYEDPNLINAQLDAAELAIHLNTLDAVSE